MLKEHNNPLQDMLEKKNARRGTRTLECEHITALT